MEASFGERVRSLRRQKGWTQRDLATKAGIDFTFLSKIENDKERASEETIRALADALGADRDELVLLSQRIPATTRDAMTSTPVARMFLRSAQGLSEAEWQVLLDALKKLRESR